MVEKPVIDTGVNCVFSSVAAAIMNSGWAESSTKKAPHPRQERMERPADSSGVGTERALSASDSVSQFSSPGKSKHLLQVVQVVQAVSPFERRTSRLSGWRSIVPPRWDRSIRYGRTCSNAIGSEGPDALLGYGRATMLMTLARPTTDRPYTASTR